ncbi:MAG: glycosyltransferase [Patescibacteria group bacterium]
MVSPINNQSFITIIIPAYNEEKRISNTLNHYLKYYNQHYPENHEILVILNGCKDKTESKVQFFQAQNPSLQYHVFPEAIGKGGAIKEGLKLAKGELVAFTDADNSTRPEILHRLFAIIDLVPSVDCAVGSRRLKGSIVTKKTKARSLISFGFNLGVNTLFGLGIRDTQCGAKVVRKKFIPDLLPKLTVSNMAFDVNFLVDIKSIGGKILEIPIEWEDTEDSTIKKPFKTSVAMAFSVLRLRVVYSPFKFMMPILEPVGRVMLKALTGKSK